MSFWCALNQPGAVFPIRDDSKKALFKTAALQNRFRIGCKSKIVNLRPVTFIPTRVCVPSRALSRFTALFMLSWCLFVIRAGVSDSPFPIRGYYMTFMRMPTFGLPEWKSMIDCLREDGGNTLLLWTAGAFRSRKFPVTWQYNREHKNVEHDFVRELIDYAHKKRIRVILCFTPFAYDGVNQYPLEHPDLKATQKNGEPAKLWGMHSWGYNLCPSQPESQRFMLEYVREMLFEFYPKADGLMIESSDYAICYCENCRGKFFDQEFRFVRQISDEVWQKKPKATILVYPHYFSGRKVPGFDVTGAKQFFDPRWTLFFTPHSAHIDTNLLSAASNSVYWTEGLTLGTPWKIRDAVRSARANNLTGYIPSLEPFSCIDGPPGSGKLRQKPFHFEWLRDGQMPLNELLIRVNRIAYREFTRNPELSESDFKNTLGDELLSRKNALSLVFRANSRRQFASKASNETIEDLLFLEESYSLEADWFTPSMILNPKLFWERAQKEKWPSDRLNRYTQRVERLGEIARRYKNAATANEREMGRIAGLIVERWNLKKN